MIELKNYTLFIDKKVSKSDNTYYALFIKIGEKDLFLKFLTQAEYDYIDHLSK